MHTYVVPRSAQSVTHSTHECAVCVHVVHTCVTVCGVAVLLLPIWFVLRESLNSVLIKDLASFREKRTLGLSWMFGDKQMSSELLLHAVCSERDGQWLEGICCNGWFGRIVKCRVVGVWCE